MIGTDIYLIEDKFMIDVAFTNATYRAFMATSNVKVNSNVISTYYRYDSSTSLVLSGGISYGVLKIHGLEKGITSNNGNVLKNSVAITKNIILNNDGLILRPKAGLSYNAINLYYDNGTMGSSNLSSDIALDISKTFNLSDHFFMSYSIYGGVQHILKQTTNKINIAGNSENKTSRGYRASPSYKNLYNIGYYININKNNDINVGLGYNLNLRNKYKAHSGFIKLEIELK